MTAAKVTLGTLVLDGGPVGGVSFQVPDWPYPVPPTVVWLTRDAAGRLARLGPDKDLLDLVAARFDAGGLGWIPYRRADAHPVRMERSTMWRYGWDRVQDPAEQKAERDRVRGLRAVAG